MNGSYQTWIVILSLLVAVAASHAALSLSQRVARSRGMAARLWLAGGALSMGVGIWSMHFIGMMAWRLPIPLAYDLPLTALSLAFAIGASAHALWIAAVPRITTARLVRSSLFLGLGIGSMHYVGMQAITIVPGLAYDIALFAASMVIAFCASFVGLKLFFHLRRLEGWMRHAVRALAAVIMGGAITGMHYTGMAATQVAPGAWCSGGLRFDQEWLAVLIAVIALGLLGITALLLLVDNHLAARLRRHADELRRVNEQLQHAATHDALTGLPNRALLNQRLERLARQRTPFAIAAFDLDRFKRVNDTLGHAAGDQALQAFAERIRAQLYEVDLAARLGGDEFVVLLEDVPDEDACLQVARKLLTAMETPMLLAGERRQVATSIGIAWCEYPESSEAVMQAADEALYAAKHAGRGTARLHRPRPACPPSP